jgi:glutamyl-tRNA synthetase
LIKIPLVVNKVRVRFAPSPTGPLHIGGLRTALFNYLFAKKNKGVFVVRIEDTDKKREVVGAEEYIFKSLEWCGMEVDERTSDNSHRQSSRKELYQSKAKELIKKGLAYYAFDSEKDLQELRESWGKKKETFIYNWKTRESLKNSLTLSDEKVSSMIAGGKAYVIRFLCPKNKNVVTDDIIRGPGSIDSSLIDDKILIKADGMPTYHFANVIDDNMMKISHVIRGEEWLPSLALHVLLYEAFGWSPPKFAHLPLILNPNGKGKLSKRSGDSSGFPVFPLSWGKEDKILGFKEAGFLPEALNNYMASLGWAAEIGEEIMNMDKLIENFKLEKVVSAAANFDIERLKWVNQKHIKKMSNEELLCEIVKLFPETKMLENTRLLLAVSLVKDRAETILDFWGLMKYLFYAPEMFDEKAVRKLSEKTKHILDQSEKIAKALKNERPANGGERLVEQSLDWANKSNVKSGQIMMTLRLALVGGLHGIDLKKIISFIGLSETSSRFGQLRKALD